MIPKLTAICGPAKGSTFTLSQTETAIGRKPSNHICIADPLLSREHCRVVIDNEAIALIDLGGRNGTFVNDVPVRERRLAHGDVIKIGDSLLILLCREEGETAETSGAVRLDDELLSAQPTLVIDPNDSLYLNSEKMRAAAEQAEKLAENLQALLRVGQEINAIRDLETFAGRLLELIGALAPAERGAILLTDAGGKIGSRFGWRRRAGAPLIVNVSGTLVQRVIGEGVAILTSVANDEFQAAESLRNSGVQSVLAAPLAVSQEVFGVIYLDSSDPTAPFADDHLQLVAAVAGLVSAALDNVRCFEQAKRETRKLQDELNSHREMIGESAPMREVRQFIAKISPSPSTVLIRGESGVGKELIARAIHRHSPRAEKPFVAINCNALPAELIESELFGHERGAFTGAITQKIGKFEAAQGGSLFLDEIGDLDLGVQVKLLRVLQEREFERVGGARPIKLDVRLLAATNVDLEAAIKAGKFRADLFYRLNVVSVSAPSLRERREDIPLLAGYFAAKHGRQSRRRIKGISAAARDYLQRYDWPGNVRELENAIERAVVLGVTEFILPEDLPSRVLEAEPSTPESSSPPEPVNLTEPHVFEATTNFHDAVKAAKKQIVIRAVEQAGGNYLEAAKLLGLLPTNLHRLIRDLNLKEQLKQYRGRE